ncbi:MAG: hypothetical protein RBU45_13105 [Myxococcota bacterium]|jgi:hypothetical protein|nr:hypothetical protein [Myxococcota bacterium]
MSVRDPVSTTPVAPDRVWLGEAGCPPAELLARAAERGTEASGLPGLAAHLAGCPTCRRLLAELVLARLPGEPPPLAAPAAAPAWPVLGLAWGRLRPLAFAGGLLLLAVGAFAAPFLYRSLGGDLAPVPASGSAPALPPGGPPAGVFRPGPVPVALPPTDPVSRAAGAPVADALLRSPRPATSLDGLDTATAAPLPAPVAAPAAARVAPPPPGAVVPPRPGAGPSSRPPRPATKGAEHHAALEELFVQGVVAFELHQYPQAIARFDQLLQADPAPAPTLAAMAGRWRGKAVAELRGECRPGFVRRLRVEAAPPGPGSGGTPGRLEAVECVLPSAP